MKTRPAPVGKAVFYMHEPRYIAVILTTLHPRDDTSDDAHPRSRERAFPTTGERPYIQYIVIKS